VYREPDEDFFVVVDFLELLLEVVLFLGVDLGADAGVLVDVLGALNAYGSGGGSGVAGGF
jgi:hypothetical protein